MSLINVAIVDHIGLNPEQLDSEKILDSRPHEGANARLASSQEFSTQSRANRRLCFIRLSPVFLLIVPTLDVPSYYNYFERRGFTGTIPSFGLAISVVRVSDPDA